MSKRITFSSSFFPVFGPQWIRTARPNVAAIETFRGNLRAAKQQRRFDNVIKWYRKQRLLWDQARQEFEEQRDDLAALLFLHDAVKAASDLGVAHPDMLWVLRANVVCAGIALHRCGMLDWVVHESEHADALRRMGEVVRTSLAAMASAKHRRSSIGMIYMWISEWARNASDQRLLGIFVAFSDKELFDSIERDGIRSSFISPAYIEDMQRGLAALQAECGRQRSAFDGIHDRMERTRRHILEPLVRIDDNSTVATLVHLLSITMMIATNRDLGSSYQIRKSPELQLLQEYGAILEEACTDPMFWFISLTSTLRSSGAMLGHGLHTWAIDLVAKLIVHPGQIRRAVVPEAAIATRSLFSRWCAPMLKGYHPCDDIASTIVGLGPAQSNQGLLLLAQYLAQLGIKCDGTVGYLNEAHKESVAHLWLNLVGPARDEIFDWIALGVRAAGDMDALIDVEQTNDQAGGEIAWDPASAAEIGEPEPPADVVEETPRTWFYVPNPAAPTLNLLPVEIPANDPEVAFEGFLREQGVETLIKPASILNALAYYESKSPVQRALSPYDDLGGHRWHKIKRGALRIYVRIEPDGRLLFHPYARKDWRQDLVEYARKAA